MQITVTIPDNLAAEVTARGLTPERYVEQLVAERAGSATHVVADISSRLADLEVFLAEMGSYSDKVPILPDEALTRESFYRDHD